MRLYLRLVVLASLLSFSNAQAAAAPATIQVKAPALSETRG